MQVFPSYSDKDAALAKKVTTALQADGLNVWNREDEILPGDNWAEKTSQALKESKAMVVLLTPEALDAKNVHWDIDYAIGDASFKDRLIPVVVGNPGTLPDEKFPWILKGLHPISLSENGKEQNIKQIADALKAKA